MIGVIGEQPARIVRAPNFQRDPFNEHFDYDADFLERGDFEPQRQNLKGKLCNAFFNVFMEMWIIFWILFFFPDVPSKPLYLAEKTWMLSWILSQNLLYVTIITASIIAYKRPMILLNNNW